MLVLTRKKGERVMIGDDIVITVIDVRGDGVRIGFDAPRGVKIQRAEVVRAVTEANTEAAADTATTADVMAGLLAGRTRSADPRDSAPAKHRGGARPAQGPPQLEVVPEAAADSAPVHLSPEAPAPPPRPAPRRRPS